MPAEIAVQFVTDAIMEEKMKRMFPVESIQREQEPSLDYQEHTVVGGQLKKPVFMTSCTELALIQC